MIRLEIEKKDTLETIINLLDQAKIEYTTDPKEPYDKIIFTELTKSTLEKMKKEKQNTHQIIFISFGIENKIYKSQMRKSKNSEKYLEQVKQLNTLAHTIIISLPYYKSVFPHAIVIEKPYQKTEKTKKAIRKKYDLSTQKKSILCCDLEYQNIPNIIKLSEQNKNQKIMLFGYTPDYKLSKKNRQLLKNLPPNIIQVKTILFQNYEELIPIVDTVILFTYDYKMEYIYKAFEQKKTILIKEEKILDDYLINSKHLYTFKDQKELELKLKKIKENRVSNLNFNKEEFLKKISSSNIIDKIQKYLA